MLFGNLGKMMKMAAEMKSRLPQMRERLAQSQYTAQAGEGAVLATVNGRLQLVDLKIEPGALTDVESDPEMLAELIKAAVSAAQEKAAQAADEAVKELTGGIDIPGLEAMMP